MIKILQILLLTTLLGGCATQAPKAQGLVLETKIQWKNKEDVKLPESFDLEKEAQLPFLIVTFKNNTGKAIYFPKPVMSDAWQLPKINGGLEVTRLLEQHDANRTLRSLCQNYSQASRFEVLIQGLTEYSGGLSLFEASAEEGEEAEYPYINTELEVFYKVLQMQLKLDAYGTRKQLAFFTDKNKETITYKEATTLLKTFENKPEPVLQFDELSTKAFNIRQNTAQFIFLQPGEEYQVALNLIGFKWCNAIYDFKLPVKEFKGFVYGSAEWDDTAQRWERKKIILPKQVGEFNLFTGAIVSESLIFNR